jgi:flavin reductase (DIM6/NTAB) family NADH-FMN oxidoreductase RutF
MKRPWNLPDLPVYSLATFVGEQVNMNICTYVSAVSMKPKRYMVAVYEGTQTLWNLQRNDRAVLQLLSLKHLPLIRTLGKKSGKKYNKQSYLERKGWITHWNSYSVLKNAAGYVELRTIWDHSGGDHQLFLFDVVGHRATSERILTLSDLRQHKLISI